MVEAGNRCASLDHSKDDPEGRSDTTPSQPGKHATGAESIAIQRPSNFQRQPSLSLDVEIGHGDERPYMIIRIPECFAGQFHPRVR